MTPIGELSAGRALTGLGAGLASAGAAIAIAGGATPAAAQSDGGQGGDAAGGGRPNVVVVMSDDQTQERRVGPWKDRVRPRLLRAKRRPEIRVDSELVDGRSFSLEKRIRICD